MSALEAETSEPLPTIEPLNDRGSAVRFETQCVVIPDPAHLPRRPRVVTKSYALPLWRRHASSPCPTSIPSEDVSTEENQSHIVLRLPLPTLSLKPHPMVRTIDHTPLQPCLVRRARSSGPSSASTPSSGHHTHTPRKLSYSPSRSDVITIPLRPCCIACQPITDAAFVGGDAWPEHFSRAASKRRSMSVDDSPRTVTVAGSAASACYGSLGVSINVDEVDKRRRSKDSTTSRETLSDCSQAKCKLPCICQGIVSSSPTVDVFSSSSPTPMTPATPCIPEEQDNENENELFPLPSPKRTPIASPVPSPAGSLSSLVVTQTNQGSAASPTPSICSGDSAGAHSSKRQYLEPPPCSSSSSLSLPKLSESTADLALTEDSPRAPSPSLLSSLPSLSGRLNSRASSSRIYFIPPTQSDMLSWPTSGTSKALQSPEFISASPDPSQLSASPRRSPTHVRFPWRSKRSVSADVISSPISTSPSTSPSLSPSSNTKKSFSMPSSRHIIADMLRGVGAMGSGVIVPGMQL